MKAATAGEGPVQAPPPPLRRAALADDSGALGDLPGRHDGVGGNRGQLGPLVSYVVAPISSTRILADTVPPPGTRSDSVVIVGSRGEYEPASVVLRAGEAEVPDLTLAAWRPG